MHEGETIRTAGPFAGTREPLGGYCLVEASDVDAAVALAARIPAARMGGSPCRQSSDSDATSPLRAAAA